MPKATKDSSSQNYCRVNPISAAAGGEVTPRHYPSITTTMQSTQNMSQPHHAPYATGGPVQYHHQQSLQAPVPARASSGAWSPQEDTTLMAARSQGLNWQPIQQAYFPNKTPNACRKRHERLMDRRNQGDWDTVKLEALAKEYMNMRREIWSPLSAKTGEKWTIVEAKCMQSGLKNLQAAARSCNRRERLEAPYSSGPGSGPSSGGSSSGMLPVQPPDHNGAYGDPDSGVGLEDLEADYTRDDDTPSYVQGSPDDIDTRGGPVKLYPSTANTSRHSYDNGARGPYGDANGARSVGAYDPDPRSYDHTDPRNYDSGSRSAYDQRDPYTQQQQQQQQQQMLQPGRDPRGGGGPGHPGHATSPYMQQGGPLEMQGGRGGPIYTLQPGRLPSIDMGIPAIINRVPPPPGVSGTGSL